MQLHHLNDKAWYANVPSPCPFVAPKTSIAGIRDDRFDLAAFGHDGFSQLPNLTTGDIFKPE